MKTLKFSHLDWTYIVHEGENNDYDFEVIDPGNTPKPQFLYKYYSLNEYSIESLKKNLIYAPHPLQLNDPYDCNKNIFDLDNMPLIGFQNFLSCLESGDNKISIKEMFKNNRKELNDLFIEGFWQIMYSKCGIVSMSDIPTNIQMWAYYSKHDGFQLKFDTQKMPNNFKGPLKIKYSETLNRIAITGDFFLPVLYQVINKEINWNHESEWRYIVTGPSELEVPLSIFKQQQKSPHDRKFPYDISALKEITLGCYFFRPDEYKKIENNHSVFDLSRTDSCNTHLRIEILEYLSIHPEIEAKLVYWEKYARFELLKIPMKIEKISTGIFEIWFKTGQIVT